MLISLELRIRIVVLMAKFESPTEVLRALKRENITPLPANNTIADIYQRFLDTGSVEDRIRTGRPKKTNESTINQLHEIIDENPEATVTQISAQLNVSRGTTHSLLHSELQMKSYGIQIHQKIYEEDYDRRVQTAEELLPLLEDPVLGKLIFASDEATFHISGRVHKQNCQIWGLEKPNIVHQYEDHSPKINVWCAMSSECIIGPFFFEESTINGQNYLEMLKKFFYPIIARKRIVSRMYFQQDGAPAHFSSDVRAWLDEKFTGRWIGRRGSIEWAARSPDLTPLDFFLWGYVKQKVYQQPIKDVDDLKQKIMNAIELISQETCNNVFSEFKKRLLLVQEQNGAHIEQLL